MHVVWLLDLQVDLLFKQHQKMLKALYSRYRLKPSGGGLRPKVPKLDGWLAFMAVSASEAWCLMRVAQLVVGLMSLQLAHKCWLLGSMTAARMHAMFETVTAEPGCAAAAV